MAGPGTFLVRKATLKDAQGILECLHEAFAPYRTAYSAEAFADTVLTPATLEQRFASMAIFVAMGTDDQVLGTIGCNRVDAEEGHIRGMAVRAAWQGHGLAQRLLDAAEAELQSLGCVRISLDTTAPLQRAIAFYLKNGFQPTGKVASFFGMALYEYAKEIRQ